MKKEIEMLRKEIELLRKEVELIRLSKPQIIIYGPTLPQPAAPFFPNTPNYPYYVTC